MKKISFFLKRGTFQPLTIILSINNLHPFSKNNHFFFFFHFCGPTCMCTHCKLDCPPPWGQCTGSFEILRPKWWRGALFCLNFTVRPMARIYWKGYKVLKKKKKKKKKLLKVKFGKYKTRKKKAFCCKKWTFEILWLQACLQWYRTVEIYE